MMGWIRANMARFRYGASILTCMHTYAYVTIK